MKTLGMYYEGTVEDITHERQVEEALRSSESLYHSLVETMPQNVFRKDLQGRFTFANRQYCEHYNCKLEDILGKTDFDFFPKELAEKYQKDDQAVMETGQSQEIIEQHHPVGTGKTTVQVVKTPLYDHSGKIIGLQGIFWDITEKKRAEEQIRRTTAELARSREELRTKNVLLEENLRMAGEIQVAMLPAAISEFPRTAAPQKARSSSSTAISRRKASAATFSMSPPLSDTEAGRVYLRCDRPRHSRGAGHRHGPRLDRGIETVGRDPGEFLRKLNFDLYSILKNTGTPMLTTAFYLVADCRTGALRFANAGHPKPLIIRRSQGQVEPLVQCLRTGTARPGAV
jgi:PAS domain S-box-containing protein